MGDLWSLLKTGGSIASTAAGGPMAAASAAFAIGGGIFKGVSAMRNKSALDDAKAATNQIAAEELKQADLADQLSLDKSLYKKSFGLQNLNMDLQNNLEGINKQMDASISKGGFATNNPVQAAADSSSSNVWDAFKLNAGNLNKSFEFETRSQELNYEQQLASIEEKKQAGLAALESEPDTFFEGVFS